MLAKELQLKLIELGFTETVRNTFSKNYLIYEDKEDTPQNKLEMIYKIKKELVYVYYVTFTGKRKVYKGRMKSITLDEKGAIKGLKRV